MQGPNTVGKEACYSNAMCQIFCDPQAYIYFHLQHHLIIPMPLSLKWSKIIIRWTQSSNFKWDYFWLYGSRRLHAGRSSVSKGQPYTRGPIVAR
jgi:hypothetical protein